MFLSPVFSYMLKTKMLYINGRSHYAHENEMLLQRSTSFRITKVNGRYIDVEVVAQEF